jgi:hypothetical protein
LAKTIGAGTTAR